MCSRQLLMGTKCDFFGGGILLFKKVHSNASLRGEEGSYTTERLGDTGSYVSEPAGEIGW